MPDKNSYLVVQADVLPDVFARVAHAKELIAKGEAPNSTKAAQMAGISRSAFYKYKDKVQLFKSGVSGLVITLAVTLEDKPGVLLSLLATVYKSGANILTINQNIPVDGVALVSLSFGNADPQFDIAGFVKTVSELAGVVFVKVINASNS